MASHHAACLRCCSETRLVTGVRIIKHFIHRFCVIVNIEFSDQSLCVAAYLSNKMKMMMTLSKG